MWFGRRSRCYVLCLCVMSWLGKIKLEFIYFESIVIARGVKMIGEKYLFHF